MIMEIIDMLGYAVLGSVVLVLFYGFYKFLAFGIKDIIHNDD